MAAVARNDTWCDVLWSFDSGICAVGHSDSNFNGYGKFGGLIRLRECCLMVEEARKLDRLASIRWSNIARKVRDRCLFQSRKALYSEYL